MKQRRLPQRYELTYRRLSFERRTVALSSLTAGLKRFLEERYRDAYSLTCTPLSGYTEISTEGIAFLLREVLSSVLGKHTVNIHIEESEGTLRITLSARGGVLPDNDVLRTLFSAASRSGVRLLVGDEDLTLACDAFAESSFFVYAHSDEDFYSLLKFMFEEM